MKDVVVEEATVSVDDEAEVEEGGGGIIITEAVVVVTANVALVVDSLRLLRLVVIRPIPLLPLH